MMNSEHDNEKTDKLTSSAQNIGHQWDGITELDNPPPRWWLNGLYASGMMVLLYFLLYPSLPLVSTASEGLLGETHMTQYHQQASDIAQLRAPYEEKIARLSPKDIMADPILVDYIMQSSHVIYGENCAACHGVGGQPLLEQYYPILADDNWLYGSDIQAIMLSIANGRQGYMPGHEGKVSATELEQLVEFVAHGADSAAYPKGAALFVEKQCIRCHGDTAQGDEEIGAANLTDNIWRFSSAEQAIRRTILYGVNDDSHAQTRQAVMPKWNDALAIELIAKLEGETLSEEALAAALPEQPINRLSPVMIKKLAIYLHKISGTSEPTPSLSAEQTITER